MSILGPFFRSPQEKATPIPSESQEDLLTASDSERRLPRATFAQFPYQRIATVVIPLVCFAVLCVALQDPRKGHNRGGLGSPVESKAAGPRAAQEMALSVEGAALPRPKDWTAVGTADAQPLQAQVTPDLNAGGAVESVDGLGNPVVSTQAPVAEPVVSTQAPVGEPDVGGSCSEADIQFLDGLAAVGGDTQAFFETAGNCGRSTVTLGWGLQWNADNWMNCIRDQYPQISLQCLQCYSGNGEYGLHHCASQCIVSWCGAGCLDCGSAYRERLSRCVRRTEAQLPWPKTCCMGSLGTWAPENCG